jgi:hypothetical protein
MHTVSWFSFFICVQSGDCSLREATIIASVLSKVSVPANHSAAALLKVIHLVATRRCYGVLILRRLKPVGGDALLGRK